MSSGLTAQIGCADDTPDQFDKVSHHLTRRQSSHYSATDFSLLRLIVWRMNSVY